MEINEVTTRHDYIKPDKIAKHIIELVRISFINYLIQNAKQAHL